MTKGSGYLRAWRGQFPRGAANYFEEASKQRLGRGTDDVIIAVGPCTLGLVEQDPYDLFEAQSRTVASARHAAGWLVVVAYPRADRPFEAREWLTHAAWEISITERYESQLQAHQRALEIAKWWCAQHSVDFDPDNAPFPVPKRIDIVRATFGVLLVALVVAVTINLAGIDLSELPEWLKWACAAVGVVAGAGVAQLVWERISLRRLKEVRQTCQHRYRGSW